jgi:hypothetical protein
MKKILLAVIIMSLSCAVSAADSIIPPQDAAAGVFNTPVPAATIAAVTPVIAAAVTPAAAAASVTFTAAAPVTSTTAVIPAPSTTTAIPQAATITAAAPVSGTVSAAVPQPVTGSASQFIPLAVTQGSQTGASQVTGQAAVTYTAWTLAPDNINFDISGVISIKLSWDAKVKENVYYNVYRSTSSLFVKVNDTKFAKTEYIDSKITSITVYYYTVEALDLSNNAYMSVTRQVKSSDNIKPNPPQGFKAYQDVQQIVLKWQQTSKTSYMVSGYNLYRGKTEEKQDFLKFVPYTKTAYNDDDVDSAVRYYYKLSTVDMGGQESKLSDVTQTMAYPPSRTGLILMPTGYRNDIKDNYGLNVDVGFSYYIGSIYGMHDVEPDGKGDDSIKKMGIWLLNLDAKYTFLNEYEKWPSLGLGFSYSILLQDSIGGNSDTRSKQATFAVGQSVLSIDGLYLTASKKLPMDNTVHAGYSMGMKLKGSNGNGIADFMPYLASSFVTPMASRSVDTSLDLRNAYFLGYSRPLFSKMGVRVEYIVPVDVNRSINRNPILPDNYLINTHIDRLFNFDIGYLHYSGGFAWVGYINLRFTVFPSPYK